MKLEVGMYVRTKYNGIFNIQVLEAIRDINCDYIEVNYIRFPRNEILKASHNIIDLIEPDDVLKYVYDNKECVSKVLNRGSKMLLVTAHLEVSLGLVNIKSIVTKEQFEAIKYEVK